MHRPLDIVLVLIYFCLTKFVCRLIVSLLDWCVHLGQTRAVGRVCHSLTPSLD